MSPVSPKTRRAYDVELQGEHGDICALLGPQLTECVISLEALCLSTCSALHVVLTSALQALVSSDRYIDVLPDCVAEARLFSGGVLGAPDERGCSSCRRAPLWILLVGKPRHIRQEQDPAVRKQSAFLCGSCKQAAWIFLYVYSALS